MKRTFAKKRKYNSLFLASIADKGPLGRTIARVCGKPGFAVLVAYLAVTFFLTHVSLAGTMLDYRNYPGQFQLIDKIYHFCSYCLLMFLVLFAFTTPAEGKSRRIRMTSAKRLMFFCCFVVCYGIFDESTQPFFGRSFEIMDMLANIFGIAFGQLLFVVAEVTGFRKTLMRTM